MPKPSANLQAAARYLLRCGKRQWTQSRVLLRELATESGLPYNSLDKMLRIASHAPELLGPVARGEITTHEALRRAGLATGAHPPRDAQIAKRRGDRPANKAARPIPGKPRTAEEQTLAACEARIEGNIEVFVSLARDLFTIREKRLYLEEYGDWERYLRERWGVQFRDFYPVTGVLNAAGIIRQLELSFGGTESHER